MLLGHLRVIFLNFSLKAFIGSSSRFLEIAQISNGFEVFLELVHALRAVAATVWLPLWIWGFYNIFRLVVTLRALGRSLSSFFLLLLDFFFMSRLFLSSRSIFRMILLSNVFSMSSKELITCCWPVIKSRMCAWTLAYSSILCANSSGVRAM